VDSGKRDHDRHTRRRPCASSLGRELLGERVGCGKQQGEKARLPAGDPIGGCERAAVLYPEDSAVERDRNIAALATAHTWQQGQAGQREPDPEHACERRRRG
jgi:hypothetical protein